MVSAPSRRAVEVLERLARQQFDSDPSARAAEAGSIRIGLPRAAELLEAEHAEGSDGRPGAAAPSVRRQQRAPRASLERLVALSRPPSRSVAIALVIAVVVGAVVLARRPPAIDERLPLAGATEPAPVIHDGATVTPEEREGVADAEQQEPATAQMHQVVFVHVAGAVASPGVVELPGDSRVVDAVRAAGGLRADADPDRVNLAAPLVDGQRVVVPVIGQPVPDEVHLVAPPAAPGSPSGVEGSGAGGEQSPKVDVNTAPASELETLPGIGPATAAAIIAHRERSGPFRSVDSLIDVRGIGEAKLEGLRDLVIVGAR